MPRTRKNFPRMVQAAVAAKCLRSCALCFVFDRDASAKNGQFAHIDRNPRNNAESNAAYLCPNHHALYDSTSHQTARVTSEELRQYQETLWAHVKTIKHHTKPRSSSRGKAGIGLDVYDRRIPIYLKARQFVRDVAETLRPELKLILKFSAETDEALFLFDESVAEYLETLFKKALRLHTLGLMRERMASEDEAKNFQALVDEDFALAVWFAEQPGEIRARFAPFLRLAR